MNNAGELRRRAAALKIETETVASRYLEENGWRYTSETPGKYWFWEKKLPCGRTVLTSKEGAMQMQEYLDDA